MVQESFIVSILSPAFIVCKFFNDGHSDWYKVIILYSFEKDLFL